MLVLSRKKNEAVMIGDIEVMVVEIRGDKVRLGFEAPPEVPVHRREVFDAIKREGDNAHSLANRKGEHGKTPRHVGFYWWRKTDREEWRIVSMTEPQLTAKWLADFGGEWGPRISPPA